jgi:hypothetical protein
MSRNRISITTGTYCAPPIRLDVINHFLYLIDMLVTCLNLYIIRQVKNVFHFSRLEPWNTYIIYATKTKREPGWKNADMTLLHVRFTKFSHNLKLFIKKTLYVYNNDLDQLSIFASMPVSLLHFQLNCSGLISLLIRHSVYQTQTYLFCILIIFVNTFCFDLVVMFLCFTFVSSVINSI